MSFAVLFFGLLLPHLIMLLAGIIMYYKPPKKINHLYGYRTNMSMQSEQAWHFAQKYSARLLIAFGGLSVLLCTVFGFYISDQIWGIGVSIFLLILEVVLVSVLTEAKLKKNNL